MQAILEDAIRAYLGPTPHSHAEAAFWIADSRGRWVFSFPVVCETLGLEPGPCARPCTVCTAARPCAAARLRPLPSECAPDNALDPATRDPAASVLQPAKSACPDR